MLYLISYFRMITDSFVSIAFSHLLNSLSGFSYCVFLLVSLLITWGELSNVSCR